jgi:hypothetical protein
MCLHIVSWSVRFSSTKLTNIRWTRLLIKSQYFPWEPGLTAKLVKHNARVDSILMSVPYFLYTGSRSAFKTRYHMASGTYPRPFVLDEMVSDEICRQSGHNCAHLSPSSFP